MEKIEIVFIPEDFKGNKFLSNYDCPLARATKRAAGTSNVCAKCHFVDIGDFTYSINEGGLFGFDEYEAVKASLAADPSARHTLTLTKI